MQGGTRMTTIKFKSRSLVHPENRHFTYASSARTWLILSGYLPTTNDPGTYINVYTAEIATLEILR